MENTAHNVLYISGEVTSRVEFSHESHGCDFYTFKLASRRLSGTYDEINILANRAIIEGIGLSTGSFIFANCSLRSFNKRTETGNKLIISAFAKELLPAPPDTYRNELTLCGAVCKPPVYRKTPLGREICDIMLATNRSYGRSDYLPIVVWGKNARMASGLNVGDSITVLGRIQSREYTKLIDGVSQIKTTFEVSASSIEFAQN